MICENCGFVHTLVPIETGIVGATDPTDVLVCCRCPRCLRLFQIELRTVQLALEAKARQSRELGHPESP